MIFPPGRAARQAYFGGKGAKSRLPFRKGKEIVWKKEALLFAGAASKIPTSADLPPDQGGAV
jgi:hypothetical protein